MVWRPPRFLSGWSWAGLELSREVMTQSPARTIEPYEPPDAAVMLTSSPSLLQNKASSKFFRAVRLACPELCRRAYHKRKRA